MIGRKREMKGDDREMGKNNVKNTLQKAINLPLSTTCV